MRLVVADTSPLRYLVQIDQIDLLPQLFEKIFIPSVVCDELRHTSAPDAVRKLDEIDSPGGLRYPQSVRVMIQPWPRWTRARSRRSP
jgi:hypothetical protein